MSRKKIDDEKLLEMLQEGKQQKEIAEYFGVSPVAVCKRIKKLIPPPESLEKLTDKEKRFAIEIASGKTQTQAALNSFEVSSRESAKAIGSSLMKNPDIQTAVADLMELQGIGKSFRVKRLADHINNRDPHVSLKALDQSWKLDGSYIERRLNLNVNHTFIDVDLSEYQ